MQQVKKNSMLSLESDSVSVSKMDGKVWPCTKNISMPERKGKSDKAIPATGKCEKQNSSKTSVCFDVVLSGNGYDYLGP